MSVRLKTFLTIFWRSSISVVLVGLFISFLFSQRSELVHLQEVTRESNKNFLVLGVILTGLYILAQSFFYQATINAIRKSVPIKESIILFLKRFFLGSFLPAGFTLSQFTLTTNLKKHSINQLESHLASMLYLIIGAVSYIAILIPTITYLLVSKQLTRPEAYGSFAVVVLTLILIVEFFLLFRQQGFSYEIAKRLLPNLPEFVDSWKNKTFESNALVMAFFYSLLVDCIGIILLYLALAAVHAPATFFLALVGYVITIVVLTISPIFQGIGLVEISLVYVLKQFGLNNQSALATTLLYRLFQLWIPLFLGMALVIHKRIKHWLHQLPALLTFSLGVTNLISAVNMPLRYRLLDLVNFFSRDVINFSRGFILVSGFLLIILAYNLVRRSRRAWQITIILVALSIIGHLTKGIDVEEASFGLVVFVTLLLNQRYYRVKNDIPTLQRGLLILFLSLVITILYGVLGFYFLDHRYFGVDFSLHASLIHIFRLYFELGDKSLIARTRFAHIFIDSIYTIGVISIFYAVFALFQPVIFLLTTLPHERAKAERLIKLYGSNSLDFFKLTRDKSYYFNKDKTAFLAYKLVNNTAVVLGDPVGENKKAIKQCLVDFTAYIEDHGWRLMFQQVISNYLELYQSLNWRILKIGEEAEVVLDRFSLVGSVNKDFRTIINKIERQGYQFRMYEPPLDYQLIHELHQVSNEWLQLPFRTERTFNQSNFDYNQIKSSPVAAIENKEGQVMAFISLILDYAPRSMAIDLMRRRKETVNGCMDYLLIKIMLHYKEKGYETVSLGLAPLSGVGETESDIPERTLKFFYDNFNQIFSYRGLRDFKAKYNPDWQPRYLVYRQTYQLPAITLASLRASQVGGLRGFFQIGLRKIIIKG